jgi:hypothetical protein
MGFGWTPSAAQPTCRPLDRHPDHAHPGNVVTVLLKLLNSLMPLVPVTMTNVTTEDFLVASDSLQANDLNITSG